MKISSWIILLILFFVIFDIFIWWQIFFAGPNKNPELYFLDVGQGDSELAILPGNIKVLIDAGPNNKIIGNLSSIFSPTDRYLDLAIISHSQLDHFGGLIDVMKRYQVGAFIFNGRRGETAAFNDLEKTIKENQIPVVILGEGDKIKYQNNVFDILSPPENLLSSAELNDTAFVIRLLSGGLSALFTGDIDSKTESILAEKFNLKSDILKVSHHGSKFSSSEEFLKAVLPKVSIIEVGKNSYGHPTGQALDRLASVGSQIFRTDKDGIVKLAVEGGEINIFKQK